jgi:hypothetical protein
MRARLVVALVAASSAAVLIPAAGTGQSGSERCWPAAPSCPAKEYERKAAQAASRHAREEFGKDFPPAQWTVVCYPPVVRNKIECAVHSRDETPYDCVGGMTMRKRNGNWRARDVEMSCRT